MATVTFALFSAPQADAMDRTVRVLMTTGIYGTAAGAAVGAAAYPFTGQLKSIFLGASIGLVLGLAVGVYHLTHEDDSGNPLNGTLNPSPELPRWAQLAEEVPNARPLGVLRSNSLQIQQELLVIHL